MGDRSISFDLKCTGCGYNLRGLTGEATCPECARPILASINDTIARMEENVSGSRLNRFDKLCASLAAVLGLIFIIMGIVGLFAGISANFSLPPILGLLPALVGWGILRCVVV